MAKPRNYYTREFKMAILSQIEVSVPLTQVAREGVHYTSIKFTECLRNHGIQIGNNR